MKKIFILVLSMLLIGAFAACGTENTDTSVEDAEKITIAVGIVPEATFVEKVAGNLVDVVTLIPSGNSPANYQPTATEMQALSDAAVYFSMQTPTEVANILPKVSDFNEGIDIVMLRDVISEAYPLRYMSEHSNDEEDEDEHEDEDSEQTVDPHIWLSPRRAIAMIEIIADKLSEIDEDNAETYQANAESYISELEALDKEISETVKGFENKSFLIYHAAYGYFSDDYGLNMVSIESDGKDSTASQMQDVIDYALEQGITTVYYQAEFDDTQAKTIADEIGGNVQQVAPLSPDYIQALKNFAQALSVEGE